MTTPSDVLQQVLDSVAVDSAEARTIERDLDRIRRGMELAATPSRRPHSVPARRPAAIAAIAVLVLVVAGAVALNRPSANRAAGVAAPAQSTSPAPPSEPAEASATDTSTADPSGLVLGVPAPQLTLEQRVAQADRIVVGTVTNIARGDLGAAGGESAGRYVLATIAISESLKPAGSAGAVVAFDYDYSGAVVSKEGQSKPWAVGDELLLFLVSDAGTISERLQPAHLQVAEGAAGRYVLTAGTLDAPFTLDDVRRLARG
ncbi:MAG: hypothetical protein ABI912_03230 [Actinomycetota bacterium]